MDTYYDFKDAEAEEDNINPTYKTKEPSGNMSPEEIAVIQMNQVLNGREDDSVSTLGSPIRTSENQMMSPARASMITIDRTSPSNSIQSSMTMESRVTALEEQITTLENNMSNKLDSSFAELLARVPVINQPPGGESAGGLNE